MHAHTHPNFPQSRGAVVQVVRDHVQAVLDARTKLNETDPIMEYSDFLNASMIFLTYVGAWIVTSE